MTKIFGISFGTGNSSSLQKMVNSEIAAAKQENQEAKSSEGKVGQTSSSSSSTNNGSTAMTLQEIYKQNLAFEQNHLSNSQDYLSSSSHLNYDA